MRICQQAHVYYRHWTTHEVTTVTADRLRVALNCARRVRNEGRAVGADGRVGVSQLIRDVLEDVARRKLREIDRLGLGEGQYTKNKTGAEQAYRLNLVAAHEVARVAAADWGGFIVLAVAREVLALYN